MKITDFFSYPGIEEEEKRLEELMAQDQELITKTGKGLLEQAKKGKGGYADNSVEGLTEQLGAAEMGLTAALVQAYLKGDLTEDLQKFLASGLQLTVDLNKSVISALAILATDTEIICSTDSIIDSLKDKRTDAELLTVQSMATIETLPIGHLVFRMKEIERNLTIAKMQRAVSQASPEEASKKAQEFIELCKSTPTDETSVSLVSFFDDMLAKEKEKKEGEYLGLPVAGLKELTKNTDGIQKRLHTIAAAPSMGKTALLLNILLGLIMARTDPRTLIFTLDDGKETIMHRLIAMLSNVSINHTYWQKARDEDKPKLDQACRTLRGYMESQRIIEIADRNMIRNFDDMETIIKRNLQDDLVILIDAPQNLEVSGRDARDEYKKRADWLLNLTRTKNIPILMTTELRKNNPSEQYRRPTLNDIAETRAFAYNADIVWLIYPKFFLMPDNNPGSKQKKEEAAIEDKQVLDRQMVLDYAKNKISGWEKMQALKFHKMTCKIEEADWDDFRAERVGDDYE